MMSDEVKTVVGQKFILVDWRDRPPTRKSNGEMSVAGLFTWAV